MKKTGKRIISGLLFIFIFVQMFSFSAFAGDSHYWKNGSTKEYVYSTVASCNAQGGDYIGYISPYSEAEVWGYYAGCYIVMYQTDSYDDKVGFVKYSGGNTDPYWHPKSFLTPSYDINIYASLENARKATNKIGTIYANTDCTQVFGMYDGYGGPYTILLYSIGYTAKVGITNITPV